MSELDGLELVYAAAALTGEERNPRESLDFFKRLFPGEWAKSDKTSAYLLVELLLGEDLLYVSLEDKKSFLHEVHDILNKAVPNPGEKKEIFLHVLSNLNFFAFDCTPFLNLLTPAEKNRLFSDKQFCQSFCRPTPKGHGSSVGTSGLYWTAENPDFAANFFSWLTPDREGFLESPLLRLDTFVEALCKLSSYEATRNMSALYRLLLLPEYGAYFLELLDRDPAFAKKILTTDSFLEVLCAILPAQLGSRQNTSCLMRLLYLEENTGRFFRLFLNYPDFTEKLLSKDIFIRALCLLRPLAAASSAGISCVYLILSAFEGPEYFFDFLNDPRNIEFKEKLLSESVFIQALCTTLPAAGSRVNLSAIYWMLETENKRSILRIFLDSHPVFKKRLLEDPFFVRAICKMRGSGAGPLEGQSALLYVLDCPESRLVFFDWLLKHDQFRKNLLTSRYFQEAFFNQLLQKSSDDFLNLGARCISLVYDYLEMNVQRPQFVYWKEKAMNDKSSGLYKIFHRNVVVGDRQGFFSPQTYQRVAPLLLGKLTELEPKVSCGAGSGAHP